MASVGSLLPFPALADMADVITNRPKRSVVNEVEELNKKKKDVDVEQPQR